MLRAAELYRGLGDLRGLYPAASFAVGTAAQIGDMAASEYWAQETERLYDAAWPLASRSQLLMARSEFAYYNHHRYEALKAVLDESLSRATTHGDQQLTRNALSNLAHAVFARGDFALAGARARALVALLPRDRFETSTAYVLVGYAVALTQLGELDEASSVLREAAPTLTSRACGGCGSK